MTGLTNKQKREWAEQLITQQGYSQKEAAAKVGVSTVTMNKWYAKYKWEELKQSLLVTRQSQLKRLYMQMDELTTAIMGREEGKRFANSKEADTLNKLGATIKTLETDASIADVVEVSKRFLNFLRSYAPDKAIEVAGMFDEFVKHLLKK
jgi:transposase-like protein